MAEVTIGRRMAFWLQPFSMNSTASQSSSSGWDGRSPWVPKSSLVSTRPRPKRASQRRFTVTRAVRGLSSLTSQRARPSRLRRLVVGQGAEHRGDRRVDPSPGLMKLPRLRKRVEGRSKPGRSFITSVVTTFMSASSRSDLAAGDPGRRRGREPGDRNQARRAACCSSVRSPRGVARIARTSSGTGRPPHGLRAVVADRRNRPGSSARAASRAGTRG